MYLGFLLMLVAKLVEGVVRLGFDIPFNRSKHTVDTGLLGALARTPCCGARRRTNKRPNRASHTASDATARKTLLAQTSRTTVAGASASPGPPSVLRPEQLNQPYREDSDDEGGYILGAWHYDEEPDTPASTPSAPSGFSRIAGGRANIASPFTMASAGSQEHTEAIPGGSRLPPGARAPGTFSHADSRRKSQSAIIEYTLAGAPLDAADPGSSRGTAQGRAGPAHAPGTSTNVAGVRGSSSEIHHREMEHPAQPFVPRRRRRWFGLGNPFASDREDTSKGAAAPMLPLETDSGSGGGSGTFVVIRERRPARSPLSQAHTPVPDVRGEETETPGA